MLLLADLGSAGTLEASLKSIWTSCSGSHGSNGMSRALGRIEDVSKLSQNFPDGARGARESQTRSGQISIVMQIVENGTRPRGAPQVLWRASTDLDDALDHAYVGRWWWRMTSARVRKEHLHILGISCAKALEPFFDEATRASEKGSKLALRPVRMMVSQPSVVRRAWQPRELP